MSHPVEFLGQSGFRIPLADGAMYIDPYLSDSVRDLDAPDLVRQVPLPMTPQEVTDAVWVLITHVHIDHCDPRTLPQIAAASPDAGFLGPAPVCETLLGWGIDPARVEQAGEDWMALTGELHCRAVPAAHPAVERDAEGRLACIGFVFQGPGTGRAYFAGDTSVSDEVLDALKREYPIERAFLPVNEQNYFRARRGIIGNMSIREAFQLAEEIGASGVFPCHWDMFAVNSAYPEEINLLHARMEPGFELLSSPCELFAEPVDAR